MMNGYNLSWEAANAIVIDVLKEDYQSMVDNIRNRVDIEDSVLRKDALTTILEYYMHSAELAAFINSVENDDVSENNAPEDWIRSLLQSYVLSITFDKIDGTSRTMTCTLDKSRLPAIEAAKIEPNETGDHIRVWDLDNNGWRSFIATRVKSVRII